MKNPVIVGAIAVAIGVAGAGAILLGLKPQDRPIAFPGTLPVDAQQAETSAPPMILTVGPQSARRHIHLVLGDDHAANREAYRIAGLAAQDNPDMALNVVPAMSEDSPLHEAFAWALAAGDKGAAFVEGLMGTTGAITPQVLTVLAQNNGLDVETLKTQAAGPVVKQALDQAHRALPPTLPALYAGNQWLTVDDLNAAKLSEALGRSEAPTEVAAAGHVILSEAYAYATSPTPKVAAVFFTLRNASATDAKITGAVTPVAGRVELHGHTQDDKGVMQMRAVPDVEVKADETVQFKPMGFHIMLFDLPAPLVVGQRFPITLQTADGTEISTLVTVTRPGEALTADPQSE